MIRKQLALLALTFSCFAVSGCALLPIPCPLELTGAVNGVRVLDAQTEQPVPDARLTFSTEPGSMNWGLDAPNVVLCSEPPPASADEFRRRPDGTFAIESRYRFVTCRPWGIGPLGCCLYEGPRAVFNIWAPGYRSPDGAWMIEYQRRPADSNGADTRHRQGELDDEGILHVYLERDSSSDWVPRPR